jgi:hypothetical protein
MLWWRLVIGEVVGKCGTIAATVSKSDDDVDGELSSVTVSKEMMIALLSFVHKKCTLILLRIQFDKTTAPIVLILIAFAMFVIQRRYRYTETDGTMEHNLRRRHSSSYNDYETSPHNRYRSFSNDSWLRQQSPRSRLWSNSFHRMSTYKRLGESRRKFSQTTQQQSSMDVVRDSDLQLQLEADEIVWQTLEHEEEDRLQQQLRDRINSRNSHGSKGNKVASSQTLAKSSFRLAGPSVSTIEYRTVAPPPSWSKASRNLILSDKELNLSRVISLELRSPPTTSAASDDIGTATLSVQKVKSASFQQNHSHKIDKFVLKKPVTDCSVHVHCPPESGVLDIYVKGTEHNEWLEQTFSTASAAAQFQMDLVALQILGPLIHNLYEALRIIHQGSDSYAGNEPVLHHYDGDVAEASHESNVNVSEVTRADGSSVYLEESGVAWDDVMRCLGSSFPSIRLRLEIMRWLEVYGSFDTAPPNIKRKESSSSAAVVSETKVSDLIAPRNDTEPEEQVGYSQLNSIYAKRRRILLGPVDFFRLFVPKLPETALPEDDCSRLRMEKLLRWRKRVARAAVLVQTYVSAKTVVNRGWNVAVDVKSHDNYWKRRLAFDDNIDNHQHDAIASNEYYEGTVSRDIDCQVRGLNSRKSSSRSKFLSGEKPTATSLYQAYSLVGIHSFQWPGTDDGSPLHYKVDPVQSIVSLQTLITNSPELDFFVVAIFLPSQTTAIVHVYVRSLPKGVDPKFDNNVSLLMAKRGSMIFSRL